ncbi:MAG: ParB/RepB/Spo0J family partition protein [Gammaproteobacteria bacterium]|nr:ParB/RepB/Spo0J family partition protein [Gammaproteobacteria bacterium]
MSIKKRGLGRGLDALLGAGNRNAAGDDAPAAEKNELRRLPIEFLQRGKYQPRKDMSDEGLEELAESIKAQGVIQPIVVRALVGENRYEIIAGERRWRAAQRAGLAEVPCLLKDVPDEAAIAMALIENIQREDLNAIEEAVALRRLMDEFGLTHEECAHAVGKSRTTITNLLRLLQLNDDVRTMVERGDLEMGHARALLALNGAAQSQAARQVVAKSLSVRETEALVRRLLAPAAAAPVKTEDPNIRALMAKLSDTLGAKVQIDHGPKGKGKLVVEYNSLDELEGILGHIR